MLFIYFSGQLCQVWVRAGTRQQRRYIAIRDISLPPTMHQNILAYHALTGCDTVSQMSGHGTKSTWKVFKQHATLLFGLRHGVSSSSSMRDAEQFLCKIYSPNNDENSINEIRYIVCFKRERNSKSNEMNRVLCHLCAHIG